MDKIEQIQSLIKSCQDDLISYKKEYNDYIESLHNRPFSAKSFRLRGEVNNLNTITYKIAECESRLLALKECLDIITSK